MAPTVTVEAILGRATLRFTEHLLNPQPRGRLRPLVADVRRWVMVYVARPVPVFTATITPLPIPVVLTLAVVVAAVGHGHAARGARAVLVIRGAESDPHAARELVLGVRRLSDEHRRQIRR